MNADQKKLSKQKMLEYFLNRYNHKTFICILIYEAIKLNFNFTLNY